MKQINGMKSIKSGARLNGLSDLTKTDLLFGSVHYIIAYSKKYNIPIKNREQLVLMSERIHKLMDEIEPSKPDESLQPSESDEIQLGLNST